MTIAIAAIFFASVALVAVQLSRTACAGEAPTPDGPPAGTPPLAAEATSTTSGPLPNQTAPDAAQQTNPADGLAGIMVPAGAGS